MLSHLQEKHDTIMELYQDNCNSVMSLQTLLRDEVLPHLRDELDLDEPTSQQALKWIADQGSIFRMLKKHKYNFNDTRTVLERTLRWRISYLAPLFQATHDCDRRFIRCLPDPVCDIFGHPVILLQLGLLTDASNETKNEIFRVHEEMRQRLCFEQESRTTLQYVMFVDSKDASIRSVAVELISWFIREVASRFPGMCAAVFVMNHSWSYGVYNIIKRLLPANVMARIHFPIDTELLACFDKQYLPDEYGGQLHLASLDANVSSYALSLSMDSPPSSPPNVPLPIPTTLNVNLTNFLPSMSSLNPYFGYPVVSNPGSSIPYLRNGRRRKRDLARTLAKLWLMKLKRLTDKTWLWIIMTVVLWAVGIRDHE
ncbi:hypothetical protein BU17DRAFT_45978 [Hysterangium stoloniferum]|nr:hypothetical protein BU17DRAFT_45978 [Hysterangium stoloniferum]